MLTQQTVGLSLFTPTLLCTKHTQAHTSVKVCLTIYSDAHMLVLNYRCSEAMFYFPISELCVSEPMEVHFSVDDKLIYCDFCRLYREMQILSNSLILFLGYYAF